MVRVGIYTHAQNAFTRYGKKQALGVPGPSCARRGHLLVGPVEGGPLADIVEGAHDVRGSAIAPEQPCQ